MKSVESVQPSESTLERVRGILEEEGPLSCEDIAGGSDLDQSTVQRALNQLWRDGDIYHTLDRQLDVRESDHD